LAKRPQRFRDCILSLEITPEDRQKFIEDCRVWEQYVQALNGYDKLMLLKLIKYFITERMSAKRMLTRAICKFNRMNMLKECDLK